MSNSIHPEKLIRLLDYTSLNDTDTPESITEFCHQAETPLGPVAAVCVYPQFVNLAKSILMDTSIPVATVINFPFGNESLESCYTAIKQAINSGATEIDAVIPYQLFLAGNEQVITEYVEAYRDACSENILLKIILETGALQKPEQIAEASLQAINAGADFIKTSTGKISQGASLEAAAIILETIKIYQSELTSVSLDINHGSTAHFSNKKRPLGLKISGGISSIPQAETYYQLATHLMGQHWVSPATFRIGSSRLLACVTNKIAFKNFRR